MTFNSVGIEYYLKDSTCISLTPESHLPSDFLMQINCEVLLIKYVDYLIIYKFDHFYKNTLKVFTIVSTLLKWKGINNNSSIACLKRVAI